MTVRKWCACAALVLSLGLSACAQEAAAYDSPAALSRALEETEVPCDNLEEVTLTHSAGHEPLVEESATCWIDDTEVTINTFADEADRADWLAVGALVEPTTSGPNWAVSGASEDVIERVASALDGSPPSPEGERSP